MVVANNLRKLPEGARKVIANSPALLDFMVAAYGEPDDVRDGLLAEVRAAKTIDQAQEIAKANNAVSELDAVPGKTVDDVYVATGDSAIGPAWDGEKCIPPERYDPITQTCVPG